MVFQFRICRRAWLLPSAFFPDHNLQRESAAASAPGGAAALFPTSPARRPHNPESTESAIPAVIEKAARQKTDCFSMEKVQRFDRKHSRGCAAGEGGCISNPILMLCRISLLR